MYMYYRNFRVPYEVMTSSVWSDHNAVSNMKRSSVTQSVMHSTETLFSLPGAMTLFLQSTWTHTVVGGEATQAGASWWSPTDELQNQINFSSLH